MASQLWKMVLCSVRRHSCQMHVWVTSCHITYAQAQHDVWTHSVAACHLLSRCPCNIVFICPSTSLCRQTYFLATLWWENIQMNVSAYTVVQVRDMCQLTLWCKWEMCQLTLWCKWVSCVSLHCAASERHVSSYTVVQVRVMCQLTLWCKWVSCVSLHCAASERHVSSYTVVQVRDVSAYTVVQVRDTCQLTLWCKWETCVSLHCDKVRDICQLTLWCKWETC